MTEEIAPDDAEDAAWRIEMEAAVRATLPTRIQERLKATGQTARGASLKAGLGPDAIRTILAGRSKSPRAENLAALARALDCDLSFLLGVSSEPHRNPHQRGTDLVTRLVLRYYLHLNSWNSAPQYHAAKMASNISPLQSKSLPIQHLEMLSDNSFAKYFLQGTLLHVAAWRPRDFSAYLPVEGELVILERSPARAQGLVRLRERTARVARRDERGHLRLETAPLTEDLFHSAPLEGDGVTLMENGLYFDENADEILNVCGVIWRGIIEVGGPGVLREFSSRERENQAREDGVTFETMARFLALEEE